MKQARPIPRILVFLLISLSGLTETSYSATLPKLAEQFNTDGSIAQLSSTAYYFGFALGIFTLGRISDFYGRRPVVIFGITMYLIITMIISQAPNIESFITLRFFQAYGASVGSVVAQTMVRDSYKDWELSYMYALSSLVVALIPSIGSMAGGYIASYYDSWRYVFYFLSLLSACMLMIYIKFLPETNLYMGSDYRTPFFALFKTLLRDKALIAYALIIGGYHGINLGFYLQAPFIFIDKLGMDAADYGRLFLISTGATLLGGLISTSLIRRLRRTSFIKFFGFALSFGACVFMNIGAYFMLPGNIDLMTNILWIFGPIACHLVGHAMTIPMLLRYALEGYRKNSGSAGSIFGSLYYCVTSTVTFVIAATHSDAINNYAAIFFIIVTISICLFVWVKKNAPKKFTLTEGSI
jgi:Bcr/CflA subfamily drug resistance transporter